MISDSICPIPWKKIQSWRRLRAANQKLLVARGVVGAVRSPFLEYDDLPDNQDSSPAVNVFGGWDLSTRAEVRLVGPVRIDPDIHFVRKKKQKLLVNLLDLTLVAALITAIHLYLLQICYISYYFCWIG